MKLLPIPSLALALVILAPVAFVPGGVRADILRQVGSFEELTAAVADANHYSGGTFTIQFQNDISAPDVAGSYQQFIGLQAGAHLVIDGAGHLLDMKQKDRAFYVANGTVAFNNLTITGGNAVGGTGGSGGGGGMGAGGAIYVANRGTGTQVTASHLSLQNNTARGGDGGLRLIPDPAELSDDGSPVIGGGGGMGGNGGVGAYYDDLPAKEAFGGGGGFGNGADGGSSLGHSTEAEKATPGKAGAYVGGASGGAGVDRYSHGVGGENGGGGGASYNEEHGVWARGAAGGGGVGGETGHLAGSFTDGFGGIGGYGGGGGGSSTYGGDGGFGGGGGSALKDAGKGGFGGGGGVGGSVTWGGGSGASGGFGGGDGKQARSAGPNEYESAGGGGMGAGGAIFVEKGATLLIETFGDPSHPEFSGNEVIGGNGLSATLGDGAALGSNVFLGGDVTYRIGSGEVEVSGLGGGGDTSDSRISGRDSDGNAQGGLIKTGSGTLRLTGMNTYAGSTQTQEGRLVVATAGIFTSGYEVSQGATLELATDAMTPAVITTEAGARVVVSASNVNLASTTFAEGIITIDGSASGLKTTGENVRIGGSGTLSAFDGAAIFEPSSLTVENATWRNGTVFEFNLGETTLVSTGTSDFSHVDNGHLLISILLLGNVAAGADVDLMTFADGSSFDLLDFALVSPVAGFSGVLYERSSGDARVLGVHVTAVPEPSVTAAILVGLLVLCALRRKRTLTHSRR